MALVTLLRRATKIPSECNLLRRNVVLCMASKNVTSNSRSSRDVETEDDPSKPLKYLGSEAAAWRAEYSRMGGKKVVSEMQMYSVIISLAVFMIYFFILREENDIDEKLGKSFYANFDAFEDEKLKAKIEYNKNHNIPTWQLEQILREKKSANN